MVALFPHAQLVQSGHFGVGCYCDLHLPFPLSEKLFPLLEESLRAQLKLEEPVELCEMVPISAAGLMRHGGQELLADQLERSSEGLLTVARQGSFALPVTGDLAPLPQSFCWKFQDAFPIYSLEEGEVVRLRLAAFASREELKSYFKSERLPQPVDEMCLVTEAGWVVSDGPEGDWIWTPKGQRQREALFSIWNEEVKRFGFQCIRTPHPEEEVSHHAEGRFSINKFLSLAPRIAEMKPCLASHEDSLAGSLVVSRSCFADLLASVAPLEREAEELGQWWGLFSSLHERLGWRVRWKLLAPTGSKRGAHSAIWEEQLIKMGASYEKISNSAPAPALIGEVEDSLSRSWEVAWVKAKKIGGQVELSGTALHSLERALLLSSAKILAGKSSVLHRIP